MEVHEVATLREVIADRTTAWIGRPDGGTLTGRDLVGRSPGRARSPLVLLVADRAGSAAALTEALAALAAGHVPVLWPPRTAVPAWLGRWLAAPTVAHRALMSIVDGRAAPAHGLIGVCSSGTSGEGKVVFLDEARCLRNAAAVVARQRDPAPTASPSEGATRAPDTVVSLRSIAYSAGLVPDTLGALLGGLRLVRPMPCTPEFFARFARQTDLSGASLRCTAAVAERLVSASVPAPAQVVLSGDLVGAGTVAALRRSWPGSDLWVGYGLSEAGPRVALGPVAGRGYRTGWLPAALPGVRLAAAGGELTVDSPDAAVALLDRGGLRPVDGACVATGDLVVAEPGGRLFLVGRRAAAFAVAGVWVHSDLVEAELRADGLDVRVEPSPGGWRVLVAGPGGAEVPRREAVATIGRRFPFLPAPEVVPTGPLHLNAAGKPAAGKQVAGKQPAGKPAIR